MALIVIVIVVVGVGVGVYQAFTDGERSGKTMVQTTGSTEANEETDTTSTNNSKDSEILRLNVRTRLPVSRSMNVRVTSQS